MPPSGKWRRWLNRANQFCRPAACVALMPLLARCSCWPAAYRALSLLQPQDDLSELRMKGDRQTPTTKIVTVPATVAIKGCSQVLIQASDCGALGRLAMVIRATAVIPVIVAIRLTRVPRTRVNRASKINPRVPPLRTPEIFHHASSMDSILIIASALSIPAIPSPTVTIRRNQSSLTSLDFFQNRCRKSHSSRVAELFSD